jgi:apolipoprotein N-acyltransferase
MRADAIAYRPWWHVTAAILTAVSRGSSLMIVASLLFLDAWLGTDFRLSNPLRLLRAVAVFCLAPRVAAWLLARACTATLAIEPGVLVLKRHGTRIEIPLDAIDHVEQWTVPVSPHALWLRFNSGRRFRYGLRVDDPVAFVEALIEAGASERIRGASRTPVAIYARSTRSPSRRWYHPVLKFVLFGLVPALPLFRLHQWIAYGGTFGEYYTYGLTPYLLGFAVYWATSCAYLLLYDAVLRVIVEPIVLLATWHTPSRAWLVRRVATAANRILYFGGVSLFLLRLFLSSR